MKAQTTALTPESKPNEHRTDVQAYEIAVKEADPSGSASFTDYERADMAAFMPASLPVTNADVIL
ncbi:hypothetical protein H7T43_19400 [Peribacillus simplex]|nr:hypothetical protein [Peribacillus simplex]